MQLDPILKEFLDEKVNEFQRPEFIELDPLQIPHLFDKPEDQEIAGFLAATIAWGNRKSILSNAQKIMARMGHSPYDFIMSSRPEHREALIPFVHRTFNEEDLQYFFGALKNIYTNHLGMSNVFAQKAESHSLQASITHFKKVFFELPHLKRTEKHVSDPALGSAAKRINMMLRWFVRKDVPGVDLGIWNDKIHPRQLSCPLDVHSGNVARKLGLLSRKQNDAKALIELDASLRMLDPEDPAKYDFALFGIGISKTDL